MNGRLGVADLPATTHHVVYQVPANSEATVNVCMVNRTGSVITVRLAIAADDNAPNDADYIEYDHQIPANGVLERTAIVASAGETLQAYAAVTGISVRIHGFVESIPQES